MSKRLARNSLFGALSGLSLGLAGFLSTVLVARVLGADGTGEVALALWAALLAATIADVGFSASLQRYIPELTRHKAQDQAVALVWLLIRLSLVGLLGILIAFSVLPLVNLKFVQNFFSPIGWMLVGICGASQFLSILASAFLLGYQRFEAYAAYAAATLIVLPSAVWAGAFFAGAEGALVGYATGYLVNVWCLIGLQKGKVAVTGKLRARVLRYSIYNWASAITTTLVWGRFEIVFLGAFTGLGAVGLFTVAGSFTSIINNFLLVITKGLLPHFSERASSAHPGLIQSHFETALRTMAFVAFPVCIGGAAVCEPVFFLLYGEVFEAAVPAATIMLLVSAITASVGPVGSSVVLAFERSDFIFYANLFGAALTILGCLVLVPTLGLMGAVLARAVVQLTMVGSAFWFLERRLRISVPFYDLARLLLAAMVAAGVARVVLVLLTGPVSVPMAVLAGAVSYVAIVRIMKSVPHGDIERLLLLVEGLPSPLPMLARPIAKFVIGSQPLQTNSPQPPRHDHA